jgi:hypothetical protein
MVKINQWRCLFIEGNALLQPHTWPITVGHVSTNFDCMGRCFLTADIFSLSAYQKLVFLLFRYLYNENQRVRETDNENQRVRKVDNETNLMWAKSWGRASIAKFRQFVNKMDFQSLSM